MATGTGFTQPVMQAETVTLEVGIIPYVLILLLVGKIAQFKASQPINGQTLMEFISMAIPSPLAMSLGINTAQMWAAESISLRQQARNITVLTC